MSCFRQPAWPSEKLPYIVDEGTVNSDYPVGLFVVDPATFAPTLQIIQIGEFSGQLLVAVPSSVWHRTVALRVLPSKSLLKPTLVEVAAALPSNLAEQYKDSTLKVWIGFLKPTARDQLEILEEFDVEYSFDDATGFYLLPMAQALVDVANEHFAFFSADGAATEPSLSGEDVDGLPMDEADAGSPVPSLQMMDQRVSRVEDTMMEVLNEMKKLTSSAGNPKPKSLLKASPKAKSSKTPATGVMFPDVAGAFPLLDPGVVNAALQAGVPKENLEQMQALIGHGKKGVRVKDMSTLVQPDPLSEEEVVHCSDKEVAEGSCLETQDPVAASLIKLTSLMQILTDDKVKRASTSRLELALEGGVASSVDPPLQGTGKKAASGRRALRAAYENAPEEISALIEKLMLEDLHSATVAPGMPVPQLCARAWVEFRSKIGAYRSSAYAAWCAAGILDSLVQGNVKKARARAAVLLLMLDQASIDKGNWTLASELALEPGPPFSNLAMHQPPSVSDGEPPYSKLLDSRWQEVALAHLKDTEDYLTKRKNLGKQYGKTGKDATGDEQNDADPKRKARPKAKAKSQAAGSSTDP